MRVKGNLKALLGVCLWLILLCCIFYIPFIPIEVDKEVNASFLNQKGSDNALIFFGFRGCNNVCPITLLVLQQFIDSQKDASLWPQVVFVDIDINSNSEEADNFAKQFHPSFVGVQLNPDNLPDISSQFGLSIKQQGSDITHLGKTYLVKREEENWKLVKVYNPKSLSVQALQKEVFNFSLKGS